MEYKVVLCLLFLVIAAYAEDKEEKVNAAVSVNISLFYFQCCYKQIWALQLHADSALQIMQI
jgi:hypothetical protein